MYHLKGERRLLELIRSCLDLQGWERDIFQVALLIWLENLHVSGINLEEYGRKELELYEQGLAAWLFYGEVWTPDGGQVEMVRCMIRLDYGPLPSDWDVVVEEHVSVPPNPGRVPGGWAADDHEGDDEDGYKEPNIEIPPLKTSLPDRVITSTEGYMTDSTGWVNAPSPR